MLACIIPGYLLLQLAKLLFAPNITLNIDNVSIAIGVFTLSYLTGLLLKWLMENILNGFLRNTPNRIRRAYDKSNCIFEKKDLPDKEEDLMQKYYIAYYKALKGNMNSSIPTLEAQIAFLRSILPVIFLYLATSYCWLVKNRTRILLVYLYYYYHPYWLYSLNMAFARQTTPIGMGGCILRRVNRQVCYTYDE